MSLFTHAPIEQRVVTTALPAGGPGSNIIPTTFGAFIDILASELGCLSSRRNHADRPGRKRRAAAAQGLDQLCLDCRKSALTAADPQLDR